MENNIEYLNQQNQDVQVSIETPLETENTSTENFTEMKTTMPNDFYPSSMSGNEYMEKGLTNDIEIF